jgi:peptidoglycan DL-endopeptidase CwlO
VRIRSRIILALAVTVTVLAALHSRPAARTPAGHAAQVAVAYARQQLRKPYIWGGPTAPGTGDGFDCSGLVMMAYRQAGITFGSARPTADVEWEYGEHVSAPEDGDLVFFAGADGTPSDPGHVGIVVDARHHRMIDAYASGFPVEYDTYGLPTSKPGLTDPVGYTDPVAAGQGGGAKGKQ